MSYKKLTIDYINNMINSVGFKSEGLKMCELGNQLIGGDYVPFKIAKEYFESLGMKHTSIDWNGKDGALNLDMNKPVNIGKFDVVTNVGFVEHVENESQCLENIHNMTRDNGIMIHIAPEVGSYVDHKCYRWYTKEWFYNLAKERNYEILDIGNINPKGKEKYNCVKCTLRRRL